jgi:hypothetical protein
MSERTILTEGEALLIRSLKEPHAIGKAIWPAAGFVDTGLS